MTGGRAKYERIIVAWGDEVTRDGWFLLAELLKAELKLNDADVIACANGLQVEKLRRQNAPSRDLIILEAELLPGEQATAGDGAELAERLQAGSRPPCCIVVGGGLAFFNKVRKLRLCEQLPCDDPTEAEFLKSLKMLADDLASARDSRPRRDRGPAQRPEERWALLEVHLGIPSHFDLRIGQGNNILRRKDNRPFEVDREELKQIVVESRNLRRLFCQRMREPEVWLDYVDRWQSDYAELGKKVFRLINKDEFSHLWGQALGAGDDNARLRFTLDEDSYDGLWESMYGQSDGEQENWMMLKGTVARRARSGQNAVVRPLHGGDGTIHMLAIASNVESESAIQGPNAGFDRLMEALIEPLRTGDRPFKAQDLFEDLSEDLDREMDALAALAGAQEAAKQEPRLVIDFLRAVDGRPLRDLVEERLARGPESAEPGSRYDVVHFAGHAMFEEVKDKPQRGFLIFGNHAERTQAVAISEFASWLGQADVQLAYLNCCRSSAARAAHELANSKVPLSIGFTWDLDGQAAVDFATRFYQQLLNYDARVCPAFQHARKQLHEIHGEDDPIWTAPVLFAQPADWDKVETCFTRH
jgi:hypothetical protein